MSFSVVIPSKNNENIARCIESLRKHEPTCSITVVDDGLHLFALIGKDWGPIQVVKGQKPFVFARNVNIGIQSAIRDGYVLLNDDALLESPGGFSLLAREAEAHPEYGIIGVTTNVTGQPLQRPKGIGLREVEHFAFVGVYIPRRTIERVGLLDERFVTYGWDDNDYCHRVKLAGLKCGVHDGCYVDHGSLKSTFRGDPKALPSIEPGRTIFQAKWSAAH